MASKNGKEPADGAAAAKLARTAASSTGDPAALAAEIEKTREDLAGTLDAIAEKVSPKRVAKRTSKKVAASVKEGAAAAKESVIEGATAAKEAVRDLTGKPTLTAPPSVEAVVLPELAPVPAYGSVGSTLNKQYVVAGALVLGLLLLLLRRRRR